MTDATNPIKRIVVNRDLCIGAASCIAVAPDVFEFDSENIAVVKPDAPMDDDMLLLAAQSCPTNAIFLYDENGKQVYPEVASSPLPSRERVG